MRPSTTTGAVSNVFGMGCNSLVMPHLIPQAGSSPQSNRENLRIALEGLLLRCVRLLNGSGNLNNDVTVGRIVDLTRGLLTVHGVRCRDAEGGLTIETAGDVPLHSIHRLNRFAQTLMLRHGVELRYNPQVLFDEKASALHCSANSINYLPHLVEPGAYTSLLHETVHSRISRLFAKDTMSVYHGWITYRGTTVPPFTYARYMRLDEVAANTHSVVHKSAELRHRLSRSFSEAYDCESIVPHLESLLFKVKFFLKLTEHLETTFQMALQVLAEGGAELSLGPGGVKDGKPFILGRTRVGDYEIVLMVHNRASSDDLSSLTLKRLGKARFVRRLDRMQFIAREMQPHLSELISETEGFRDLVARVLNPCAIDAAEGAYREELSSRMKRVMNLALQLRRIAPALVEQDCVHKPHSSDPRDEIAVLSENLSIPGKRALGKLMLKS
jgi:hypothetical protein